jgi:hypothetical protein
MLCNVVEASSSVSHMHAASERQQAAHACSAVGVVVLTNASVCFQSTAAAAVADGRSYLYQ